MNGRALAQRLFFITFSIFMFSIAVGRINLKPYGIPLSYGGSLENLFLWPLVTGICVFLQNAKALWARYTWVWVLALVLLLLSLFQGPGTAQTELGSQEWVRFHLGLGVFCLTLVAVFLDPSSARISALCLFLGTAVAILRGLWFFVQGSDDFALSGTSHGRLLTPIGHPNFLGGYLVLILPMAAAFPYKTLRRKIPCLLPFVLLPMLTIALVLSYSRSAWLGGLVTLGTSLFLFPMDLLKKRLPWLAGAVVLLMLVGVGITLQGGPDNPLVRRVSSVRRLTQERNFLERIYAWSGSLEIIRRHPLKGIGLGTDRFKKHYVEVQQPESLMVMPHPHNVTLHAMVAFGAPFGLCLLALWFGGAYHAFRSLRQGPGDPRFWWPGAALCAFTGFSVYACFDSPLFVVRVTPLLGWVTALLYAAPSLKTSVSNTNNLESASR